MYALALLLTATAAGWLFGVVLRLLRDGSEPDTPALIRLGILAGAVLSAALWLRIIE